MKNKKLLSAILLAIILIAGAIFAFGRNNQAKKQMNQASLSSKLVPKILQKI